MCATQIHGFFFLPHSNTESSAPRTASLRNAMQDKKRQQTALPKADANAKRARTEMRIHKPLVLRKAFVEIDWHTLMLFIDPLTKRPAAHKYETHNRDGILVQHKRVYRPGEYSEPGHISYALDNLSKCKRAYKFGLASLTPFPVKKLSPEAKAVRERLWALAHALTGNKKLTVLLVNRYVQGGKGTLTKHRDDEKYIDQDHHVLSVTFTLAPTTVRNLKWYYAVEHSYQNGRNHVTLETTHGDALWGDFCNHLHQVLPPSDNHESVCLTFRAATQSS